MKLLLVAISVFFSCSAWSVKPPIGTQPSTEVWLQWTKALVDDHEGYVNGLVMSESPYLKQHANNPINWVTWPLPRQNEKLLFISIGYASCHWCHQMNEHTFMDVAIAKVLNQSVYSVKVDRDEYPEVDHHYLKIQQQINGEGGWPISIIALPNGDPIWVGGYEKPDQLARLVGRFSQIWQVNPTMLASMAASMKLLTQAETVVESSFVEHFLGERDFEYGGRKGAVKFPDEMDILYHFGIADDRAKSDSVLALKKHLDALIESPLHDGINGGYYRYATRTDWSKPHFEKMIYNQAQLLVVYSRAYAYFNDVRYKLAAQRIYDFMFKNMRNKDGLFITSMNADWQGEEGGFYLWSKDDLLKNLPDLKNLYEFKPGRWQYTGLTQQPKLLQLQEVRGMPTTDARALTGLNGLVLWSLIAAHQIGIDGALSSAKMLADHLFSSRYRDGVLKRICYKEDNCIVATVDDYAYLTLGVSSLGAIDEKYLNWAHKLFEDGSSLVELANPFCTNDREVISPLAALLISSRLLKTAVPNEWLSVLGREIGVGVHAARALMSSNILSEFAQGHGTLMRYEKGGAIHLILALDKGWHVNSSTPDQDYLIPTKVVGLTNASVEYPAENYQKVDFDDALLSLYENGATIAIYPKDELADEVKLHLQPCSDRMCLPPEVITIH